MIQRSGHDPGKPREGDGVPASDWQGQRPGWEGAPGARRGLNGLRYSEGQCGSEGGMERGIPGPGGGRSAWALTFSLWGVESHGRLLSKQETEAGLCSKRYLWQQRGEWCGRGQWARELSEGTHLLETMSPCF